MLPRKLKRRVIRSEVEGVKRRKREREYQRRYAARHGYYWLPCVICGEHHGGHEAGGILPKSEGTSVTICPWCTAERQEAAERELARLGYHAETQVSRWAYKGVVRHRVGARPSGGAP